MLALLLALAQLSVPPSHIPIAERQALLDLYRSTEGGGWINKEGWGCAAGTECGWAGISCWPEPSDPGPVHAVEINLPRNNLRGSLPESLASLESLIVLNVSGNTISTPLSDALIRRWEAGSLDIEAGGAFSSFDEIRLRLSTVAYCANEALVLRADGSVSHFWERCRWPKSGDPKPYCEVRRATTHDFSQLSRFLIANGIFDPHEGPLPRPIDAGTTTVSVKGPAGIHSVEIFDNGRDFLRLRSCEMVIRGVAESLAWDPPTVVEQCPWSWQLTAPTHQ